MNLHDILADIHALEEDLLVFERKYGLRSETFYAAYVSGEEPDPDGHFKMPHLWPLQNTPPLVVATGGSPPW